MTKLVREFTKSWTPRQRLAFAVCAVACAAVLYFWLVHSAVQARAQLQTSVSTLRAQAAQLEQQSAELSRLRTATAPTAARADLRSVVQAHAEKTGVSRALVKLDMLDRNRVQVTFGALPFSEWLDWIQALQTQQARLETCRIEALSTPGMVSITATLARPQ